MMAIRPTIQIGHPALKSPNQEISNFSDPKLSQLITDLVDTMRYEELIGIAAPQIAENYQVFVTEPRATKTRSKDQVDELRVYINPKIVSVSDEQAEIFEGRGSVIKVGIFGPVVRPKVVTVEAFDQLGHKFRFSADGILGRVIQHELDHLEGIAFLSRVSNQEKSMATQYYLEKIKYSPAQQQASIISIKELELI